MARRAIRNNHIFKWSFNNHCHFLLHNLLITVIVVDDRVVAVVLLMILFLQFLQIIFVSAWPRVGGVESSAVRPGTEGDMAFSMKRE